MGKVFKKLRCRYQKFVRGARIKGKSTAPPGKLLRQAFWHPKGEISINRPRSAVRGLGLKIGPKKKFETPTARSGGRGPAVGIVAGPGKNRCGELWRLENA